MSQNKANDLVAHYMRFVPVDGRLTDKIGGCPTHLPPRVPVSARSGRQMKFVGQFYRAPGRLEEVDCLCVHIYQSERDEEPWPVAIVVPAGSARGPFDDECASPPAFSIEYEAKIEPSMTDDPADYGPSEAILRQSKVGGVPFYDSAIDAGDRYLLQLREQPAGLNWGGWTLVLVLRADGEVEARLG